MIKLKCLFLFESTDLDLIEIKREGLSADAPLSETYKWLVLAKNTGRVLELDFHSMSDTVRVFKEGSLDFTQEDGVFRLLGKEFKLQRKDAGSFSESSRISIEHYLARHLKEPSYRDLRPADVKYFLEWVRDGEVIKFSMTKFHLMKTDEEIRQWFYSTLIDAKVYQVGMTDPDSSELIGYAGISALNPVDKNGEYFILIGNKKFWRRGIASQVTRKVVADGFKELALHRIFLTASDENLGAVRAYEKAGFVHEGKMREAFFREGSYSNKIFMGILRSEWRDL